MRLSKIARIVSKNITIDSESTLEVQIFSLDCTDEINAKLIVTPSETCGTSYTFMLTVNGQEVTRFWIDSYFGIHYFVGEKEYKTNRNYIAALAKKGFSYDEIIRISNEMYESIMLMQELERDAKAEHAASVEEESTVDTVKRENLIGETMLELGKTYIAYEYHLHTILHTYKAQIIRRTKKTVTVEVWRDNNASKVTFENRKIMFGGVGEILTKDVEYFSVYDENLCDKRLFFPADRFEEQAESAEENVNVPEDDGSNDDDYDEEEITIDYKFDIEEEDDDDELIDPPEESKAVGFHRTWFTNDENAVAKFEVGKTYRGIAYKDGDDYRRTLFCVEENMVDTDANLNCKIVARHGIFLQVEDVNGNIFNKRVIRSNSLGYWNYLSAETICFKAKDTKLGYAIIISANNVIDSEEELSDAVATVQKEGTIEDDGSNDDADEENVALTTDYNFDEEDEDDELVDSAEEIKVEKKETEMNAEIAAMEKEVERKKRLVEYKTTVTFPQRLKRFSEQLINLYAQIAEVENEMWDYQLYAEEHVKEYEDDIAALEAEIFNRKMIEAQEYINVSEEAFNISVQAEIDAANKVKAIENLKQAALNTAVTEVEPVSFAIERFNEGEVETAAAVVDTSVTSVAEVPIVDAYAEIEDEIKCKLEAIEGLKAEVEKLREQLKDLKKKDAPVDEESALIEELKKLDAEVDESYRKFFFKRETLNETRRKLTNVLQKNFEPYVYLFNGLVEKASDNDAEIILHSQDGKGYDIAEGNWEEFDIYLDFANSPKYIITYRLLRIAEYQTLDAIKAAIKGLVAAIERGDEEFAFPADNSAQKK